VSQKLLYTEQVLDIQERQLLIFNHLKHLIQNFEVLPRTKIKNNLLNLYDILERYS